MNIYCEFDSQSFVQKSNKKFCIKTKNFDGLTITHVDAFDKKICQSLHKKPGYYSTIFYKNFDYLTNNDFKKIVLNLCKEIKLALKKLNIDLKEGSKCFVVGLGNGKITADTLGIKAVNKIICTTDTLLKKQDRIYKNIFGNVFSLCPSVASINGLYTYSIIKSIVQSEKPDLVILIDSLSCKDIKYLAKTFQINTSGLTPGCEIGNRQPRIDKNSLKIPVLSIGCPMVCNLSNIIKTTDYNPVLTLKDIDIAVQNCAEIIAFALNKTIHKKLSFDEIVFLSKN